MSTVVFGLVVMEITVSSLNADVKHLSGCSLCRSVIRNSGGERRGASCWGRGLPLMGVWSPAGGGVSCWGRGLLLGRCGLLLGAGSPTSPAGSSLIPGFG